MSDENYKVQVSYKVGTNMAGMINVRGDSVEECDQLLQTVREILVPNLAGFEGDARAVGLIAEAFPETRGIPQQQPQQQTAQASGPTCMHGPRIHRQGPDWQGWFCRAERNDPSKCKPQYIR